MLRLLISVLRQRRAYLIGNVQKSKNVHIHKNTEAVFALDFFLFRENEEQQMQPETSTEANQILWETFSEVQEPSKIMKCPLCAIILF